MARCPAHQDRTPSLSIGAADDGKVLIHCHAGCSQEFVIAALRQCGLWMENGSERPKGLASADATPEQDLDNNAKHSKSALKVWQSTKPPYGTAVEQYLG